MALLQRFRTRCAGFTGLLVLQGMQATVVVAQTVPWEGPICTVARSLSGPVARAVAVIAIVMTGLMLAFGELKGTVKSLLGLVFGIGFALLADQWLGLIRAGAGSSCVAAALPTLQWLALR
jgi:type IV secretion system protein TrbC